VSDLKTKVAILEQEKQKMEQELTEALKVSREAKRQIEALLREKDFISESKQQLGQEKKELEERATMTLDQLRQKQSGQPIELPEGFVEWSNSLQQKRGELLIDLLLD